MNEPYFTLLPPYDIPGVIVVSGLLVENRGEHALRNIRVHVEYEDASSHIHHIQIVADDEYILRGGGTGSTFATLRLRSLRGGGRLIMYFAATAPVAPRVAVTAWDGA